MPAPQIRIASLNLQERDVSILCGLFECRVMTNNHAAALYFDGKSEAAKKRLQKLKSHGLIGERPRRTFDQSVLFLTRKGLLSLHEKGVLTKYPAFDLPVLERRARVSELTIRHELEVMDVKTAFHAAVKTTSSFTIQEFSTWPLLNEFEAYHSGNRLEVLVKPDGFICIHETGADGKFEHSLFLEVDRSSEVQEVLIARAGCYLDYYKSGRFAVRNGAKRSDYKDFPFRVLMVFKTAERRNNTAERLLQCSPPILTHVCLSTFDEVTANPLGSIWIRPLDYREATRGTHFDIEKRREKWRYQRQAAREAYIEKNIRKIKILAEDVIT